jgi:hypothetical protein
MDRLTGQLYHLPGIIAKLGISVANGQKALNAEYLNNIKMIMAMIHDTIGDDAEPGAKAEMVKDLLKELAPSRYQFTETTLDFSADLSERKSSQMQGALGGGFAGVTLSVGYARAFGYDYRAAARITTKLHAIPANEAVVGPLLERAKDIDATKLALPEKTEIEKETFEGIANISSALAK